MEEFAQDMDWSPKQACINLEKATQYITKSLQREISRNQELCSLIRRLEEREVESGRSLAEEVESNQQLRFQIDDLNKRLKEKDGLLAQANQALALLKTEQRDLHQQLQQHRTIQEVNEWLQGEDTQVKVEVSPEDEPLEAPAFNGIKVEEEEQEEQANGENSHPEERTDSRTELSISVAAEIKTELIEEENMAPSFHLETHLPSTDADGHASSSSSSEQEQVPGSFSHPLHRNDNSTGSQLISQPLQQPLQYQCNQCSKTFPQLGGLVRHQCVHAREKSFCCAQCGKSFHHESSLVRHQRIAHAQDTAYNSSHPGESFPHERHLNVHIDQHVTLQHHHQNAANPEETLYGCGRHDGSFSQEAELTIHQHQHRSVHTDSWLYNSPQSNNKHLPHVSDGSSLHQAAQSSSRPYNNSTRPDKSLARMGNLSVPQQQTRTAGHRLLSGLQSGRTFAIVDGKLRRNHDQRTLGPRHRAQRGGGEGNIRAGVIGVGEKRPHQCAQCGRRFTQLRNLRTHQKFHTGERLHDCVQCGKSFTSAGNLRVHQRVHTGERPYTCKQCGRGFTHEGNLRAHQRIHTGEKPYHCARCGRSFTRSTYIKLHQCV